MLSVWKAVWKKLLTASISRLSSVIILLDYIYRFLKKLPRRAKRQVWKINLSKERLDVFVIKNYLFLRMFFGAFIVIRSVKSAAKYIGILEILSDKSEIEEFSIYTVYRTKST